MASLSHSPQVRLARPESYSRTSTHARQARENLPAPRSVENSRKSCCECCWFGRKPNPLIAAPRQRNTNEEKAAIKEGRVPDDWKDKPAKLRQKDRDARWTVKFTKAKQREDGSTPPLDLAIPIFGYQNHISIDRGLPVDLHGSTLGKIER